MIRVVYRYIHETEPASIPRNSFLKPLRVQDREEYSSIELDFEREGQDITVCLAPSTR